MSAQIYAVVQMKSVRKNYKRNIEKHMEYIRLAAQQGSEIVVFPEMSLTGYERELAGAQSFTKDDPRLECLKKASSDYGIVIVAGRKIVYRFVDFCSIKGYANLYKEISAPRRGNVFSVRYWL